MKDKSPEKQLAGFIAKYTPEIAALAQAALIKMRARRGSRSDRPSGGGLAQAALIKMRARLPGAIELIYDNYNALAIGFSPTERTSEAVFSIALYPCWASSFFLHRAKLPDPKTPLIPFYIEHTALAAFLKNGYAVSELS